MTLQILDKIKAMIAPFAYIKIHKCGSTTGRFWMEQIAEKGNLKILRQSKSKQPNFLRSKDIICKEKGWDITSPPYSALTNHTAYDTFFFSSYMLQNLKFYTMIRNPLSRAISCLYSRDLNQTIDHSLSIQNFYKDNIEYITSKPCIQDNVKKHFPPVSLKANFISYKLGFDSLEEISKEALYKRYSWIGLLEKIDKSFNMLQAETGLKLRKTQSLTETQKYPTRKNHNSTYSTLKNADICKTFLEEFIEINSLDYKIYNIVQDTVEHTYIEAN